MKKIGAVASLVAAVLCLGHVHLGAQEDVHTEIQQIRKKLSEMESLKARLSELVESLEEQKKSRDATAQTVTAATKDSKIKIDARMFVGLFGSGDGGYYPNWSTDIKDAKLRFTYSPSKNITVVNRFSTSGASTGGSFDYFYLDYKGLLSPTNTVRVGQRKIDIGQETWVDNPAENMLISTAVSSVAGYATGVALLGTFAESPTSPLYEVGFMNGTKGSMVRPTSSLPCNIKVGVPISENLFASASYFDSGDMGAADKPAISVAGLSSAPDGALQWDRKIWELDLRYNYGCTGIRPLIPTGTLPPVMFGATWGGFNDNATGASDRNGNFWFVEGLVRLTPRVYSAARYSVVDLSGGARAKLGGSPADVNSYKRISIGLGYVVADLTHLKLEYSLNDTSGGQSDPGINQWAIGVASRF